MSGGATRAEALVNVEDAIIIWLHVARKHGWTIPEPARAGGPIMKPLAREIR